MIDPKHPEVSRMTTGSPYGAYFQTYSAAPVLDTLAKRLLDTKKYIYFHNRSEKADRVVSLCQCVHEGSRSTHRGHDAPTKSASSRTGTKREKSIENIARDACRENKANLQN